MSLDDGDLFGSMPSMPRVPRARSNHAKKSKLPMKGDAEAEVAKTAQGMVRPLESLGLFATERQSTSVTWMSPIHEKIALFIDLFRVRKDRIGEHWTSNGVRGVSWKCSNLWKPDICIKKEGGKCQNCDNQAPIPFDDQAVEHHFHGSLKGRRFAISSYAIRDDGHCLFVVAQFRGEQAQAATDAYGHHCQALGIPRAVSTAPDQHGFDAWIFFSSPARASTARNLASLIITKCVEGRPEIGFEHYNALIPDRDKPDRKGGLGSAVELPFQCISDGPPVGAFVDEHFELVGDQWEHLSSIRRVSPTEADKLCRVGPWLGIQKPVPAPTEVSVWTMEKPDFVTTPGIALLEAMPSSLRMHLADQLYVDKTHLPPPVAAQFARLATFQNAHFYDVQNFGTRHGPEDRIVSHAKVTDEHVILPRGCLDEARELAAKYGMSVRMADSRTRGRPLPNSVRFKGVLRPRQAIAHGKILEHDTGILVANPAFGKTVVGIASIAARMVNTIILTFTKKVFDQWFKRLEQFLDIDPKCIGRLGAGRNELTGIVDVVLIHNLTDSRWSEERRIVAERIADYGHVIIDEVHHLVADTFGPVVGRAPAAYMLSLTATLTRSDGMHPGIKMLCGPVRDRIFPKEAVAASGIAHYYRTRPTSFTLSPGLVDRVQKGGANEQDILAEMEADEERNMLLYRDIRAALDRGRSPILLTKRRNHLDILENIFRGKVEHLAVFKGGMSQKEEDAAELELRAPDGEERLVIAMAQYLGEGFDDARLDSMHIAMPSRFEGTLEQYAGRLQRWHEKKDMIEVWDYADVLEPALLEKAEARRKVFDNIGFTIMNTAENEGAIRDLFDGI